MELLCTPCGSFLLGYSDVSDKALSGLAAPHQALELQAVLESCRT
jgi:hypothetical protein